MTRPTKQTRPRLSIFWLPEIALRYLPTWQKLALLIVVGSVIPLLAVGWLANTRSQAALDLAARDKLELVRTARAMQVQEFFRLLRADAKSIAENPTVVDAVQAFAAARTRAASAMAAEFQYQQAVVRYGAYLGAISDAYDEMLLLDVNGNVVYSSTGDKPPTDTNETLKAIAEGVTRGHVLVTDMSLDPETGRAVGYAATEVVTQTGTTVGFVAVQYTGDQLGTLTADYSGLGVTGDVYLVGADGRLRSPTRFGAGGSDDADVAGNDGAGEVLRLAVDTVAAQQARRGVTGAWRGTNYAGEQVISAYQPLGIGGLDWAIVAEMSEHEALAAANDLTRELATVTGVLVALTALLGLYVTTALTRPMRAMVRGLGHLAAGELNVDNMWVRGRDEAAQMMESFNRTVTNLRELIGGVTESARAVEQAAAEFEQQSNEAAAAGDGAAQAIEQVAVGARGEQEALEETRRVLIDLTQAIEQTAAGAQTQAQDIQTGSETMTALSQSLTEAMEALQRVSDASARNATSAEQGTAAVREGMAAMEQMRQFVMDAATRVRELGQRTAQIDEILEVLREIAEQTNLLALNAAIEAARVGAQGRGFAIVAEEVRSLAVRSNESAQDIGELIAAIQGGTEEVVSLMNQGATHAEAAAAVAETSGEALEAIVTAARGVLEETAQIERRLTETVAAADTVIEQIERVAAVAAEHSAAAEEMAAGSTQASASMDSVAALSTENAAAASQGAAEVGRVAAGLAEIARGAMTLTEIAARLREDVNKFKL